MGSPVAAKPWRTYQFSTYEPPKWDQHKATISELYEREELKDVMRIMKDEFGFKASENQYKKQIAKWRLNKKHVKSVEYKAMLRKKRKREQEGKETEFVLHGHKVPDQNIARFEDRMIKKEEVDEDDPYSTVATPQSLVYRTPPSSESAVPAATPILQIPLRLSPPQRLNYVGYENRGPFFQSVVQSIEGLSEEQSASALKNISHSTTLQNARTDQPSTIASLTEIQAKSFLIYQNPDMANVPPRLPTIQSMLNNETELLRLNKTELDKEIQSFAQLPEEPGGRSLLQVMISASQNHYDIFCTQCESFGYSPSIGGCSIHRCLLRILAQYKLDKLPLPKADMLCRGAVEVLFPKQDPPLASSLRVAVDLIWISIGVFDRIAKLVAILQIPTALIVPEHASYRALIAHCALILARSGHTHESVLTLKSAIGPESEDLQRTSANFSCQDLNFSTLSFEQAVSGLTMGRVRVFQDRETWSFFDCDAEEDVGAENSKGKEKDDGNKRKALWYKERDGSLRREELVVAGIAVRTMVEIEYLKRRTRA